MNSGCLFGFLDFLASPVLLIVMAVSFFLWTISVILAFSLSPVFALIVRKKAEQPKKSKKPKILQRHIEIIGNLMQSTIFSAMVMAMSIYRTLCVLVHCSFVMFHSSFVIYHLSLSLSVCSSLCLKVINNTRRNLTVSRYLKATVTQPP